MTENFSDRVAEVVLSKGTRLVLGLDPRLDRMPQDMVRDARAKGRRGRVDPREAAASVIERFCSEVLASCTPFIAAAKLQLACFEALGAPGYAAYERLVDEARTLGVLTIADAKRGDIGSTSELYAAAHLGVFAPDAPAAHDGCGADAITVNPYMGRDSVEPFLKYARERGKGVFVLCRTSNPGAADFQERAVPETPLYLAVASRIRAWGEGTQGGCGLTAVGAVVGATSPAAARRVRDALPDAWLLVPGIGPQGGQPEDVKALARPDGLGLLANASRSVLYASNGNDWREAAAKAAKELAEQLRFS